MRIKNVVVGLLILDKYVADANLHYVANSFPNGTPNHPKQLYIKVDMDGRRNPEGRAEVNEDEERMLKAHGWGPECEHQFWCFYD